jgi:hypothetical protein
VVLVSVDSWASAKAPTKMIISTAISFFISFLPLALKNDERVG